MYLLFDVGGTHTRIAKTEDLITFDEPLVVPTPPDFDEAMKIYKKEISALAKNATITSSIMGVAGRLDRAKTKLMGSRNLRGWEDRSLRKQIQAITGTPVFLENDADLAGLGESTHGAGKGHEIVAYLTISTGVGGGRIVNGEIDKNMLGFEPGKQIIDLVNMKTLEDYVSGNALFEKTGQKSQDIKDPLIWDRIAKTLAIGICNTINYWSPSVVVLGGAVVQSIPFEALELYVKRIFINPSILPEIKKAELGDFGGLYGGMEYLKSQALPTYQE